MSGMSESERQRAKACVSSLKAIEIALRTGECADLYAAVAPAAAGRPARIC